VIITPHGYKLTMHSFVVPTDFLTPQNYGMMHMQNKVYIPYILQRQNVVISIYSLLLPPCGYRYWHFTERDRGMHLVLLYTVLRYWGIK